MSNLLRCPSPQNKADWTRSLQSLLTGSIFLGTSIAQVPMVWAASPVPGTIIENQATGTFRNPANGSTNSIESNIVQVTVAEVTGITLVPAGVQEAPRNASSPVHQNDGNFDADDRVYFLFTATNVGNDPTQFFIPGSPSALTHGTQSGAIEIIDLDPDGASGPIPATNFSSLPITIRPEGNKTGDATALGMPVGSIPAGGSMTLRVPVKIDSGAIGNVSVTLGDVSPNPNNNSVASQNQDYQTNSNLDLYTVDNSDFARIADEASGIPINGDTTHHRKESSATSALTIGGNPSTLYLLSGIVYQDQDGSNTQNNSESGINNVTVRLYSDTNNDGQLTVADDSDGDGEIDRDDAIAVTSTDATGLYQFNRGNGNYLIEVDSSDSTLIGFSYGGLTGNPNNVINLPRNVDVTEASILTGLDFPFDAGTPPNRDYGDAPDTGVGTSINNYKTTDIDNGPYHIITPNLFIGRPADEDDGTLSNANADADDRLGIPEDEGGVQFTFLKTNDPGYSINNISVTNTTGSAAQLVGWIDFDQSGTFDPDESTTTAINSTGTQDTFLVWNTLPSDITAGTTYVRLRLTTDSTVATGTASTSIPNGAANDGEVEDYSLTIRPANTLPTAVDTCEIALVNSSFESPNILVTPPAYLQVFEANKIVAYNENNVPGWDTTDSNNAIEIWRTGNFLGTPAFEGFQFAELNAYSNGILSQDVATVPGQVLTWQFAHRGRVGTDTMSLRIGSTSTTVAQINPNTGTINFSTNNTEWQTYQGTYVVPAGQTLTRFEFAAVATATGDNSVGNFLDAIRFGELCDHGDASDNYPVLRGNGGAAHILDGTTYLGSGVLAEPDGQRSIDATGDDNIGNDSDHTDDEDGVIFTSELTAGGNASVTVTASSSGFLNAWVDFNQDGDWDNSNERIFADQTMSAGVNSLSFAVPSEAVGGNTFARFRFSQTGGLTPTGIASTGEVEDYRVGITAVVTDPNVLLVKRITRINDGEINNRIPSVSLNVYDPDPTSPYDDNLIEATASPADTNKWPGTTDNTTSTFLIGARDGGVTEPGDEIEYTIYFLSTGEKTAESVLFCDRIPDGQTFVPNPTFAELSPAVSPSTTGIEGADRGILVSFDGSNTLYTNIGGDDTARFYPPGSGLPPACNLLNNQSEHNGAIVVTLGDLPQATAPGTPSRSYGFVRFRATVDP